MLSTLACGAVYALPVGNPSDASLLSDGFVQEGFCGDPCDPCLSWCDAWSFRVGFYGDYVFNRHLETDADRHIERFNLNTNAGLLVLNVWDRVDVFATLGASNFALSTNASAFNPALAGVVVDLESETEFSWSVGGRATLWEFGCTSLGIEGQYFAFRPDVTRVTIEDTFSNYPDSDTSYREWQVGLGISHRINILVPYVAVKWSHQNLSFKGATVTVGGTPVPLNNLTNDKCWGYAVGVSLVDCEKMSVTAEARFADEKAFHVNAQLRF